MTFFLRHPHFRLTFLAICADMLCLAVAASAFWIFGRPAVEGHAYFAGGVGLAVLAGLALAVCDAYNPAVFSRLSDTTVAILSTMGIAFAVAMVVHIAIPAPPGLVPTLSGVASIYFPLLIAGRVLFRGIAVLPSVTQRALILGHSELGTAVADELKNRNNIGIELVGFLVDELDDLPLTIEGYPVLGRVHQLEKLIDNAGVDLVIVASKSRDESFPADQLLHAKLQGVHIESGVSFYERLTGRIYPRDLRSSYLIFAEGFGSSAASEAVRRGVDVLAASVGLLVTAPLLLAAALAIKLDSKGPIFYRQERVGKNGRNFEVLKLRSMREDAERESGPTFTTQSDARVTRVGRFLRMTRLDEVPQYWNVIVGDMSLVGPRPERPEFTEMLNAHYPFFRLRLACKPGLTGWAQVKYGYVDRIEGFENKLGLDLYYLRHRSLLMDLVIVFQTVKTVLLFRGV